MSNHFTPDVNGLIHTLKSVNDGRSRISRELNNIMGNIWLTHQYR